MSSNMIHKMSVNYSSIFHLSAARKRLLGKTQEDELAAYSNDSLFSGLLDNYSVSKVRRQNNMYP